MQKRGLTLICEISVMGGQCYLKINIDLNVSNNSNAFTNVRECKYMKE